MGQLRKNGIIYGGGDALIQPVIYSTEERCIGVWTDGKPLYEKTIEFGALPNNTTKNVAHNIANVDTIWVYGGFVYSTADTTDYEKWGINRPALNAIKYQWEATANRTNVKIVDGEDFSGFSAVVTVRYTKTTDTAGDGDWSPLGISAVHYSEQEQVVGTWIDGKTIYGKLFTLENSLLINADSWGDTPISNTDKATIVDVKLWDTNGSIFTQIGANRDSQLGYVQILNSRNAAISINKIYLEYTKVSS